MVLVWYECVWPNRIGRSRGIRFNLNSLYMVHKDDVGSIVQKAASLKIYNDWHVHTWEDPCKDRLPGSACTLFIAVNNGI